MIQAFPADRQTFIVFYFFRHISVTFSDIAYKSVRKHRKYGHPAYKSLNYKNRGIFLSYALRYYVKPKSSRRKTK